MNSRISLAMLAVAALLAAYVYFVEMRGEGEVDASALVLRFEPEQVQALELPLEGGGNARLVRGPPPPPPREGAKAVEGSGKGEPTWALESPVAFAADADAVKSALDSLSKLERKTEIKPEGDVDLSAFGFAVGAQPVRITLGEGEPLALEIGGSAPLGAESYVRRDGTIYTVEGWRTSGLKPTLAALRDKRVSHLMADDVDRLTLYEDGQPLAALERRATDGDEALWHLLEPLAETADAETARRLISDLVLTRAIEFVDQADEPAAYGLRAPRFEVVLSAGEQSERIALGQAKDKTYARVEGQSVIYEIPERVLSAIPREIFAYRDKRVLRIDDSAVSRVVLEFPRDQASYAFRREDERFVPEDDSIEVESEKVSGLLFTLSELDATALVEQSPDRVQLGLDPPRVRVRFEGEAKSELGWLELGEPTADEGTAALSSRGERIYRVSNELGKEVPLGEEAFFNNFAARKGEGAAAKPVEEGPIEETPGRVAPSEEPTPEAAAP